MREREHKNYFIDNDIWKKVLKFYRITPMKQQNTNLNSANEKTMTLLTNFHSKQRTFKEESLSADVVTEY